MDLLIGITELITCKEHSVCLPHYGPWNKASTMGIWLVSQVDLCENCLCMRWYVNDFGTIYNM